MKFRLRGNYVLRESGHRCCCLGCSVCLRCTEGLVRHLMCKCQSHVMGFASCAARHVREMYVTSFKDSCCRDCQKPQTNQPKI